MLSFLNYPGLLSPQTFKAASMSDTTGHLVNTPYVETMYKSHNRKIKIPSEHQSEGILNTPIIL
jgi:hypothetical protein